MTQRPARRVNSDVRALPLLTRASAFDKALREIAVPALAQHGFAFDGKRTFRRVSDAPRVSDIINFQLGQRSMSAKFTVNLGIFAEGDAPGVSVGQAKEYDYLTQRRTRIGSLMLKSPTLSKLPWVGFLFGVPDKWWWFSETYAQTRASVTAAVETLVTTGVGWFATNRP